MSLHLARWHSHLHGWLAACLLLLPAAASASGSEGLAPDPASRIDTRLSLLTPEGHRIVGARLAVSQLGGKRVAELAISTADTASSAGSAKPAKVIGTVNAILEEALPSDGLCHLLLHGGDILMAAESQQLRVGNDTRYENVVPCSILDQGNLPRESRDRLLALNQVTSVVVDTVRLYQPLQASELKLGATLDEIARGLLGPDALDLDGVRGIGYGDFSLSPAEVLAAIDTDVLSKTVRQVVGDALGRVPPVGPNIVMIVADDLGYGDVGALWPQSAIATPNLNRIADAGARFTNFHAQPVCASTRASLLTGYYHRELGIAGAGGPARAGIPRWVSSMPETLLAMGYSTAAYGKWHLSYRRGFLPPDRGFQDWLGFYGGASPYSLEEINKRSTRFLFENRTPYRPEPGHTTDLFADRALQFIARQTSERPFFLYLAFNAPHTPIWRADNPVFSARPDWLGKVSADTPGDSSWNDYLALVQHMDARIGDILDLLETRKLDRDTLVIFLSDNGADLEANVAGDGPGSNGPYRGGKGSVFEGGTRVPLLMQWPAGIRPGTKVDDFSLVIDLWPTIRQLAGVHPDHGQGFKPYDGQSLVPLLSAEETNSAPSDREGWLLFPLTGLALHQPPWKLIRHADGSEDLFHLLEDPAEASPRNTSHGARLEAMSTRIDQYLGGHD